MLVAAVMFNLIADCHLIGIVRVSVTVKNLHEIHLCFWTASLAHSVWLRHCVTVSHTPYVAWSVCCAKTVERAKKQFGNPLMWAQGTSC